MFDHNILSFICIQLIKIHQIYHNYTIIALVFLENQIISLGQLLPDVFVAGTVKEKYAAAQDAIDDRECAVESDILLIFAQGPGHEAHRDHGQDDQIGPLHDLGR